MRAYLSVPIVANRSLDTARLIAGAISAAGHEIVSPWVLTDGEARPSNSVNIFLRGKAAIEQCDWVIADVSKPSTGVGMEVMTAYLARKRIVLLAQTGSAISRMLMDLKEAEWVYFSDEASLLKGLEEKLR